MATQRFASLIQRIPRGLLAFLDVKAGGEYPVQLITQLQPTIDLTKWYAAEAESFTASAVQIGTTTEGTFINFTVTSVTDITDGVSLTVPQTQVWVLQAATVEMLRVGGAVGDIFDAALCFAPLTSGTRSIHPAQTLMGNPYLGQRTFAMRSLDNPPWILPSGTTIGLRIIYAQAAAGTPFSPVARLRLLRFQA